MFARPKTPELGANHVQNAWTWQSTTSKATWVWYDYQTQVNVGRQA
jgi:hypothetical protein